METDSGIVVDLMLMRGKFDNAMTFDQWWDKNEMDRVDHADRTSSEEVWSDAQSDVWADVFQLVSDHAHMASREFIRKLEKAREAAGYGPAAGVAR